MGAGSLAGSLSFHLILRVKLNQRVHIKILQDESLNIGDAKFVQAGNEIVLQTGYWILDSR